MSAPRRELGLDYEGIEFNTAFRLDRRGLLGEAEVRPYSHTVDVEARVATGSSAELFAEVVEVTEHCCPVRDLLVDAGVTLAMIWSVAATPRHDRGLPEGCRNRGPFVSL